MSDEEMNAAGLCPGCPPEPLPQRRARCPMCREWIYYQPKHKGHKFLIKGKWRKSVVSGSWVAYIGHINANHAPADMLALYEGATDELSLIHISEPTRP